VQPCSYKCLRSLSSLAPFASRSTQDDEEMEEIDTINPFAEPGSSPAPNNAIIDDDQLQPPPVPVKPPSNAGSVPATPAPAPRSPLEGRRDFCCAKDRWLREEGGEIHVCTLLRIL
jgi:hypothetical protein